jgi:hypothetical protein
MPFTIDQTKPEELTATSIMDILELATVVETIIMNDTRTCLHITTAAAMAMVETTAKNTRAADLVADPTHQEVATQHAAAEEAIAASTPTATTLISVIIQKIIMTEGQITEFLNNLE